MPRAMKPFTMAAIQSASVIGNLAENIHGHSRFIRIASQHGADVVVWPELSLTGDEPPIAKPQGELIAQAGIAEKPS